MVETSIIIPIKNNRFLDKCLKSLLSQNYQDFEIILVFDGQKQEVNIKNQKIKQFIIKHSGPALARNFGASKALGKILVFVDSDMEFDRNFLGDLIKPIIAEKTKGTFSRQELVANWDNQWARFWNFNLGLYTKKRIPENYPDKSPVFRAIIKSEFDRVKGFSPIGYDDDWSLSEKLKYKASVCQGAVYYHNNPDNLKAIFFQAKWRAKRQYKLGIFGEVIKLFYFSLPVSIVVGLLKSLILGQPLFMIFKLVFDCGTFLGLIEKIIIHKLY
jgi:glycosyltransferase involved in cell wall biosynthesis